MNHRGGSMNPALDSRARFEAWWRTRMKASPAWCPSRYELPGHRLDGVYISDDARVAWEAWQAAIASMWLPIETAPRDGSEILLGRAASEELDSDGISVPGYWQEGYEDGVDYMGCDSGFVDSHHQTFGGGRSFGAESHRYAPNQPTHWQPLPAPPTPQDPPIAALAAKETT